MESKAKLLGHPIHPMLVRLPAGPAGHGGHLRCHRPSQGERALVGHGLLSHRRRRHRRACGGGLRPDRLAGDPFRHPRQGHRPLALGVGNVVVVALFAVSGWFLRWGTPNVPATLALILSFVGVVLALVTGWLGGELVDRLGVGVDDGAHLDAPSSLSGRPGCDARGL